MKRKQKEQLKAMSAAELEGELKKMSQELFKLSFSEGQSRAKNPLRKRTLRREVAMVKGLLRNQQMALRQGESV